MNCVIISGSNFIKFWLACYTAVRNSCLNIFLKCFEIPTCLPLTRIYSLLAAVSDQKGPFRMITVWGFWYRMAKVGRSLHDP